jgi:enterochelin esterase-like enzyme
MCVALLPSVLIAQQTSQFPQGKVLESLVFESKILSQEVKYSIYLPADYDISNRKYPVVYLLHGGSDTEISWIQWGEVNLTADRAIASRRIPPMIIVMPTAKGSRYNNNFGNNVRYEDMFIQEFIPYVDKTYRTRTDKRYRGIAGQSMGGYGSLSLAMRHPNLFTACSAFSSWIPTEESRDFNKEHNPIYLAKTLPVKQLESVHWFVDCGDGDSLYKASAAMHAILKDRNIRHEYRVCDGGHSWSYWHSRITEGLEFIGKDFRKQ